MAKISPSSIKYSIVADFVAEGPFQKPDVIGALFGQTEGLLGPDMELRELQKEGKIGRIEVELTTEEGRTKGEIVIPSALDKTETTIIAAALETIDKIGPTDAKITIREIVDVRGSKRDYIMERAKELLANIKNSGMDSVEIENELRESSRIAKVTLYGEEGLAAGPEVESSDEIIVVEGRADVINLLRHGVKNAIGMHGTKFPKTIAKLGETKEITLFVDGDRGGKLIAKNVCDNANVAYVAMAPSGKEVEELTGKEILQALRKKVPAEEFLKNIEAELGNGRKRELTEKEIEKLRELSSELKGRNVLVLDESLEPICNVPSSRLSFMRSRRKAFVLLVSNATASVVVGAEKLGAFAVAAKTFGRVPETKVRLISI
ncbi:DNA primase [Candidatus Pacearchaeota archaeon]|nr:MAG: DNA primase [Candidatus Pacearchaeota archaeon]